MILQKNFWNRVSRFLPEQRGWVILLVLLLCSWPLISTEFPIKSEARLILKIITMDKNFDRFGDPIRIGVSSAEVFEAFQDIPATMKLNGKPYAVEKMESQEDISKYKVVYIDTNWERNYEKIARLTVENKILVFCRNESSLNKFGGAITFRVIKNKPNILFNSQNAKNQGSDFNEKFLQNVIFINK